MAYGHQKLGLEPWRASPGARPIWVYRPILDLRPTLGVRSPNFGHVRRTTLRGATSPSFVTSPPSKMKASERASAPDSEDLNPPQFEWEEGADGGISSEGHAWEGVMKTWRSGAESGQRRVGKEALEHGRAARMR